MTASTTTATVTGLTAGTLYEFAVTATNSAGESYFSNILSLEAGTIPDQMAAPTLA